MSKAEETRAYIIEKTAPLFNTKGYAGTSLADITEATGLTKGSIYGNFSNKDEVALAVYEHSTALLKTRIDAAMATQATAAGKLSALLAYYRDNWKRMFEKGGCPIMNAAIEADDNLPFLKKQVQNSIKNWAARMSGVITLGKENGEFKTDVSATEYAYAFITLIEGGIMLAKITNNQHHLFAALDRVEMVVATELKR